VNVSYGDVVELTAIAQWIADHARTGSQVECHLVHPPFQLAVARGRTALGWTPPALHARLAELYAAYAATDGIKA
jgi:hypothetical protein